MKSKNYLLIVLFSALTFAQNTRITDNNSITWFNYNGTFKLNTKIGLHTEYQWRRAEALKNWQQGLLRLGINYQPMARLQLRAGYAWAETYNYGDIPINNLGKNFTEHRLYQMATITDKLSILEISHRFMLEQRWIGRYTNPTLVKEDDYVFMNRLRYMFRAQMPLKGNTIREKIPYIALYDEILIGFGNHVNQNIFDQNRFGLLLGYKCNKTLKIEAGYVNQILQLGREINDQNVFQHNNGILVSTLLNFDLQKKAN
jgi:hypothetical protein